MSRIFILSGPVHSGKTTRLMKWAVSHSGIDGIFQPVVDGKRFLYHLGSRTLKPLETESENDYISIGKYKFSIESFKWSQALLEESLRKELDWLIIDEIGPLELAGKGIEPAFSKILSAAESVPFNILCVVREEMLDKFVKHYYLENKFKIFDIAEETGA